jgi:hypothetical protein
VVRRAVVLVAALTNVEVHICLCALNKLGISGQKAFVLCGNSLLAKGFFVVFL